MTSPKLTLALLMVAATSGAAVAAAAFPPSQGTRDFDTSRAAPLSLPPAKAVPLPKADFSATSRSLIDADTYTTVTLNRDGSTEETPASDALRAIVEGMAGLPSA